MRSFSQFFAQVIFMITALTGCTPNTIAIWVEGEDVEVPVEVPGPTETVIEEVIVYEDQIIELASSNTSCLEDEYCYQVSVSTDMVYPLMSYDHEYYMGSIWLEPDYRFHELGFEVQPTTFPLRFSVSANDNESFAVGCETQGGSTKCINDFIDVCVGINPRTGDEVTEDLILDSSGYGELELTSVNPLSDHPEEVLIVCFENMVDFPSEGRFSMQGAFNFAGTGLLQVEGGMSAPGLEAINWDIENPYGTLVANDGGNPGSPVSSYDTHGNRIIRP